MSFIQVTKEEFNTHAQQVSERSFMQTEEMAKLLEKRGFSISYVAWKEGDQLEVSAIVYSMPMTGGLRMEVNCGPIHSNAAHLSDFYQGLKDYAKENSALELLIKFACNLFSKAPFLKLRVRLPVSPFLATRFEDQSACVIVASEETAIE